MSARDVLARARCERHWRTPCDMAGCTEFSCEWRKGAEADLAALSAAGLVVVPREPTRKMQRAGENEFWRPSVPNPTDIYRAMIAATSQEASDDAK